MAVVLFVTKDKGGFNAAHPHALALKMAGHTVVIVAEGLSAEMWKQHGWQLDFEGTINFLKESSGCDPEGILAKTNPDVVVTTLGAPIHLESQFSNTANTLGIPLVWIEDVWGAHVRSDATPELIFCFDKIGGKIIQRKDCFKNTRIEVVGDFGLETIKNLAQISGTVANEITRLKQNYKYLVHLGGQGIFTSDLISILRDSVALTPGLCAVIPRLHPKYKDTEHMAQWQQLLGSFPAGVSADIPGASSDQLAVLCDVTWSTFGTGMRYAAYYGNMVVSVVTRASHEAMLRETGLDEYPLVTVGAAVEVREPVDLDSVMKKLPKVREAQKQYAKPDQFDGEKAVRAIEKIVRSH
jgi:hypothetical protein